MTRLSFARKDRSIAALADREFQYGVFFDLYDRLVEVLCNSAQFEITPRLDDEYVALRRQMQARYPSVRPFLISYLEFVPNDEEAGLKLCGRPLDAFEVLVAPIDLREFFRMDDGNMISRLTRTREALTLYGEHLRLLAAQMA